MSALLTPSTSAASQHHAALAQQAAPPLQAAPHHFVGIDWVRALMSVAVVVWHLGGVGDSNLQDRTNYISWRPGLVDLIDLYVCLLAVPLFVLVSAFLFCQRGATTPNLWRRVSRLGYLLMFWPLALIVWNESRSGVTDRIPSSVREAFATLLSAGTRCSISSSV